ncbi:MAG: bifunctional (p)ppGpp synthetase/guanosine-3',5'-bis(diphosphate) 3'-pyrophosphohydrolase [Clostridia bacterium]|jgi:myo-inositol-1(or 4)-monophosphatase|nr:bifunctional (p)ppGpp synthetase/guanosine-3',5'-bis(diphosphate) 3'-pyrophosphohydrolase [Clostridia bacterium]MDO4834968.1 HD domain-containing protein [Clostridia bacterium]
MEKLTLFEEAICFAVRAHHGQVRKGEMIPYICHPMEVATICATVTADQEVLAAAVLHDTVEDTDTTIGEIRDRFGLRVAALVAAETEDKRDDLPQAETWRVRKEESLVILENAKDEGVKILWLGDKLANLRSIYRSWRIDSKAVWQVFHQKDPAQHAWYYRRIAELLSDYRGTRAWQELDYVIGQIFKGV